MNHLTIDLTNCEQEPIHILGHIQSHGYLVALRPHDYTVVHASANVPDLFNQPVAQLLGQSIGGLLAKTDLPADLLLEPLNIGRRSGTWESLNPQVLAINGRTWNLLIHKHNELLLLEWEPTTGRQSVSLTQRLVSEALAEVQSSRQLVDLLQNTARRVRTIIGFDRVMVYRFADDWHGQVIAEDKADHLDPFLGLHYPASDIPRQARELYKTNLVRLIADVNSTPSPLLSLPDLADDRPLDLTHASLRAVSPVHIEYLKNMDVGASMSISLLYRGELWGLMSCHHETARFVDYEARQAAKFVSQLLSSALEFRKDEENQTQVLHSRDMGKRLHEQLVADEDIVRALTRHATTALDLTTATGAVLLFNNHQYRMGNTPPEIDIAGLIDWLSSASIDTFLQTDHLASLYPPAEAFRDTGAGLLAIVLSKELNEYLLWFRPEQLQQVTWAGNPDKPVSVTDDGQLRISPRKSFAAWTELVRNQSESWPEFEIAAAVKLREDILQIVTRQANEVRLLNQRLQAAYEELDAFSYTVSHDLRTPLSSIRCYSEILLEEHGSELDDDARVLFQKIIDSTDRMRSLIRHILYYSRMGRTDINAQPIDMDGLLQTIREEITVSEKDRVLTIDVGDTPNLQADPVMVRQLFSNLLSNAAKYTRNAPEGRVRVSGTQSGEDIIYTVTDNGIGFEMKEAGKMFDLFKRLENARSFEGSGVGLAIVKRITMRHNGKIWYHSEPNQGATFSISFPADPAV